MLVHQGVQHLVNDAQVVGAVLELVLDVHQVAVEGIKPASEEQKPLTA